MKTMQNTMNIRNTFRPFSTLLSDYFNVPKLNHKRNLKRLVNTLHAITLYSEFNIICFSSRVSAPLNVLCMQIEDMYTRNPDVFVVMMKGLANWGRINLGVSNRRRLNLDQKVWSDEFNCPKILIELYKVLDSLEKHSHDYMLLQRVILTMLESYQCVVVPKHPNLDTITADGPDVMPIIESFDFDFIFDELNIKPQEFIKVLEEENSNAEWHISSAAGPNGQSLWMSHIDAKAIAADKELRPIFEKFCKLNKREYLIEKLDDSRMLPQFFKVKQTQNHSKLHVIYEKGNKARVIAILDYWTQEVLCPLHNTLQKFIGKIENDGTFDQDKIATIVSKFSMRKDRGLYSLDLSAATDRLPRLLQEHIIKLLTCSEKYGSLWGSLLTSRDFLTENGQKLRYSVGQPMGAKTSFPMLALTHHVIVKESARRAGLQNFSDYVILGDDIVINDTAVSEQYIILMKSLGLEISLNKSIICYKDDQSKRAEICKRLYFDGHEYSPLPTKLLATVLENGELGYQLQEELGRRGLLFKTTFFEFMAGIISKINFNYLAKLNGLPQHVTGMLYSFPIADLPKYNCTLWEDKFGISVQTIEQFFSYVVIVEQLKRLDTILKNTRDTYTTIVKAAGTAKAMGIGSPETGYLPIEQLSTPEGEDDFEFVNTFHPAIEAVKSDVKRINLILAQMISSDTDTKKMLLSGLIDSLKISSFDMMPEMDVAEAKAIRKLVDATLFSIDRARGMKNKSLLYSVKLETINLLWNVKVAIGSYCVISRTISKTSGFAVEAKTRYHDYIKQSSDENPFSKD